MKRLTVFLSCPTDAYEYIIDRIKEINDKLRKIHNLSIDMIDWNSPKLHDSDMDLIGQEIILKNLPEYDLYFGVMKSRYGTPIGKLKNWSGTEVEFRDALMRRKRTGNKLRPRKVVFTFIQAANEIQAKDSNTAVVQPAQVEEGVRTFMAQLQDEGGAYYAIKKDAIEIGDFYDDIVFECLRTPVVAYSLYQSPKTNVCIKPYADTQIFTYKLGVLETISLVKEKKLMLITGIGGSGKTSFLEDVSSSKKIQECDLIPIFVPLNVYGVMPITDALDCLQDSSYKCDEKTLLLLDGYDQVSDKPKFNGYLQRFLDGHPITSMIITSRPLCYYPSVLKNFHHYEVCDLPLTHDAHEIRPVESYDKDRTDLIQRSQLELKRIPILVNYFSSRSINSDTLDKVLREFIEYCINWDKTHFDCTYDFNGDYDYLVELLFQVAFVQANSGRVSLSNEEIDKIIDNHRLRRLFKSYTTLVTNTDNSFYISYPWVAQLCAACFVSQLKIESLIEIITSADGQHFKSNWMPYIPDIVQCINASERDILVKQIMRVQPDMLLALNASVLEPDIQENVFIRTFIKYAETTGYIPLKVNSLQLAALWDTQEKENYLLNYICDPKSIGNMVIEAFIILSYSTHHDKAKIDETLLACLQNDKLAVYRRRLNYVATHYLKIDRFDQTILDKLYDQNPKDTIHLLAVYDKSFKYINALIELYKETDQKPRQDQADFETEQSIEDYLVYCVKSNHLKEVIEGIIKSDLLRNTHCLRDEMKEIVQSACDNYMFDEIYEEMYRLFVHCIDTSSDEHLAELSVYFIKQNAEYQVVKRVFDEGKDSYYGSFLVLLNSDSIDFVKSICNDLIPKLPSPKREQIIKQLANIQIPFMYNEILEQMGISLEQYKVESVQERKKKRLQKDMDLVLNVDLLIRELDDIFGEDSSITYESSRLLWNHDICTVIYTLIQDYRNSYPGDRTIPKKAIIDTLKRNHQNLILDFVTSNFKKQPRINAFSDDIEIEVCSEIKEWLNNWKIELLQSTDITSALKQIDSVRLEIDTRVETLWALIKEDLVEVKDAVLLDFLSFVWDTSEDWSVIEAKIGNKQQIRTRVAENLKNKHLLASNPLANHIWFCTNNHYYEVLPHSYDILRRLEVDYRKDEHLRYCCLESIIRIENNQTRFSDYVIACPIEILGYFARGYVKDRRSMVGLIERLKTEVKLGESESTLFYLYCLVCMGDIESLPRYIDMIKRTQDFRIEYEYPNPFELITDEIQLGLLLDLLFFSFLNEIRQSQYHNLTRCILSSVENIAYQSQENYENTLGLLTDLTKQYPKHNETYVIYEYLWKIKEEMPKRTTKLPTLLESLTLYNKLNDI